MSHALWALAIGVGCAAIAIAISQTRLARSWELHTYDARMWLAQKSRPKPRDVVMFYVDEPSLRRMEGQGINWPWPRELYASAMNFCRLGGARAVLFDLFFSEDSVYGVGDDEAFASGVAKGPPSYFVAFLTKNETADDPRIPAVIRKGAVPLAQPYPEWMRSSRSLASLPIEPLVEAATGFGNAQMPPDEDGVYRRIPLIEGIGSEAMPSIPLKVASDIKQVRALSWPKKFSFMFGGQAIPLDGGGHMMLNYYGGADTFPAHSLADILVADAAVAAGKKPDIDPAIVKDKVVIIGVAAPGLYDLKPMPLSRVYPGPEIHATAIENILTSDFITPAHRTTTALIALFASLAAALGLAWMKRMWGIVLLLSLLALSLIGGACLLFWRSVWVPIVSPAGALALSAFAMSVRNFMTEGRKKREIRRAFGQYLSPHIVGQIAEHPESLSLGGAEQEITIFFSDIADFTSISEKITPAEIVEKLNGYFSGTTRIIQASGGTLDKYIGDAIMAFWGAPLPMADHAVRAATAAIDIQKWLAENSKFTTRIGIHTGPAVVGNIGSDIRFNYTAIGDAVNLSSRLEGLNKKFGTRIILSEPAWLQASASIRARRIGRVRVKGRAEPIGIYEPLGLAGEANPIDDSTIEEFARALGLFETSKFGEAGEIFGMLAAEKADAVSRSYKRLCAEYTRKAPDGFDGAITFTTK
ncbi:MAG: adenylate/guanylate cyclase domain-containing protein [Pseudomonadota bacterium]